MKLTFILIDDDPVSNLIHKKIIEITTKDGETEVISFLTVKEGLDFIEKQCHDRNCDEFVILLDINMPGLNGWDFLDQLGKLPKPWNNVYILSSSIAKVDLAKANSYGAVKGYLYKPLTIPSLKVVLQEQM